MYSDGEVWRVERRHRLGQVGSHGFLASERLVADKATKVSKRELLVSVP